MKRIIGYKVFIRLLVTSFVIILCFVGLNYSTVNRSLLDQYINDASTHADIYENYVAETFNKLETDIGYLGKDLRYNTERDIYLLQDFVKQQSGVSATYLFDTDKHLIGEAGKEHKYRFLIEEEIQEKFFYEPYVWTHLDDDIYILYYKVLSDSALYIGFVVELDLLLDKISENPTQDISIINDFGLSVTQTLISRKDDINELNFRNQLLEGHEETVMEASSFYSFKPVDINGVNLFLLYKNSQQEYSNTRRKFLLRNFLLALFMISFVLLQGWQLIKKLYDLFIHAVVKNNYKIKEFSQIKDELNKAIHWVDDVVKHYDELNALKEELIVLSHNIPEEGEDVVKKEEHKKS